MASNNSFEKINYTLRPAKSIERKMILQFFSRLSPFDFIENYHYIGFGSIYYSDFILIHKTLNVQKMSSIEFERNESRARFNLPFSCINLFPGTCNQHLPNLLKDDEKTITWLDYDSPLSSTAIDDIQTFTIKACSGSVLLVTFNANSDENPCLNGNQDQLFQFRLEKLQSRVLKKKLPRITKHIQLNKKNMHKLYREIVINEIKENLIRRNKLVIPNEEMNFKQIMNFTYSDDAKMMTLGFVFYRNNDTKKFYNCKFEDLPQYRDSIDEYNIVAPRLTADEIKALNKLLPKNDEIPYIISEIDNKEFSKAMEEYAEVYQYFPNFSEILH